MSDYYKTIEEKMSDVLFLQERLEESINEIEDLKNTIKSITTYEEFKVLRNKFDAEEHNMQLLENEINTINNKEVVNNIYDYIDIF